jgi:hypothetical protein
MPFGHASKLLRSTTTQKHEGILVVWLTDWNVNEFYDENGGLLKTVM